jgi:hypothetical protein
VSSPHSLREFLAGSRCAGAVSPCRRSEGSSSRISADLLIRARTTELSACINATSWSAYLPTTETDIHRLAPSGTAGSNSIDSSVSVESPTMSANASFANSMRPSRAIASDGTGIRSSTSRAGIWSRAAPGY